MLSEPQFHHVAAVVRVPTTEKLECNEKRAGARGRQGWGEGEGAWRGFPVWWSLRLYLSSYWHSTNLQLICFIHLLIQGWTKCRHSFVKVKELLIEHGGRIVDLDEAKLTHIVIDKRDISRRVELDRRTCKQVYFLNLCGWINERNGG